MYWSFLQWIFPFLSKKMLIILPIISSILGFNFGYNDGFRCFDPRTYGNWSFICSITTTIN